LRAGALAAIRHRRPVNENPSSFLWADIVYYSITSSANVSSRTGVAS
jgi:hypothetical protein